MLGFEICCRPSRNNSSSIPLTVEELTNAENYWISYAQQECFFTEIESLKHKQVLPASSKLLSLRPFIDSNGILRVGGRQQNASLTYSAVVLPGKHQVTRLIDEANMSDFYTRDPHSSPLFSTVDFTSLGAARLYVTLPVVAAFVADLLKNPGHS